MTSIRVTVIAFALAALVAAQVQAVSDVGDEPSPSLSRLAVDRKFRGAGASLARLGFDLVDHVRIDSAGRIVVAGARLASGEVDTGIETYVPLVARLLPNGRPDRSFGADGVVESALFGRPTGLVFGPKYRGEETILFVGRFVDPESRDIGVARLYPSGQFDNRFGTGGVVEVEARTAGTWRLPAVDEVTGALTVVAGDVSPQRIVRVTSDGLLDSAYGEDGVVALDGFYVMEMTLDAAGGAVVSRRALRDPHQTPPGTPEVFDVVRFDASGVRDLAFGGDGMLHGPGGGAVVARRLRFDAAGRIGVLGQDADGRYGLFRFLGDGALDAAFSQDGFARDLNCLPGDAERGGNTLDIATGGDGAYVESGSLTAYSRTLSQPRGSGFYVQSVDPADPSAVRAAIVRDRRPIDRAETIVTTQAVAADGASVIAGGRVVLRARGHARTVPFLARVSLANAVPAALPDVRIAGITATADQDGGAFRISAAIDLVNDGGGNWANGRVELRLSDDDVLDDSDVRLDSWSTGPVGRGRRTRLRIESGWYSFGDVPDVSGKRILAVLNPGAEVMETGGANALGVSPVLR